MEKKVPIGLVPIALLEILMGLIALILLVFLITYQARTGDNAGMLWILFPIFASCPIAILLGIGLLYGNKIARIAHFIFLPIILVAVAQLLHLFGFPHHEFGSMMPFVLCGVFCIFMLIYLNLKQVKQYF